jgi:ABC-type multidrug transport system fused ATPase/permease subunit
VWTYFMRALSLAFPYWYLLCFAVLALAANSTADLWIPKVQGSIINSVIYDHSSFKDNLTTFIVLNVLQGLFMMIRNGCFRIIASNISNDVRNKLFRAVVFQGRF